MIRLVDFPFCQQFLLHRLGQRLSYHRNLRMKFQLQHTLTSHELEFVRNLALGRLYRHRPNPSSMADQVCLDLHHDLPLQRQHIRKLLHEPLQ